MRTTIVLIALMLGFSALSFALDCAASAYVQSCNKCTFDATTGKMDPACYSSYQSWGTKCIAEKRPLLASKYSSGNCPAVDACASALSTCKSSASSGNDKTDCLNPMVGMCFTDSDACVVAAEKKCTSGPEDMIDDLISDCPLPIIMILGLPVMAFLYSRRQ